MMDLSADIDKPIFRLVGECADRLGREAYVIGGYVRDIFLKRPSSDIDFVTVGSGIELAKEVAKRLGKEATLAVYATYGTAQVCWRGYELEFVGARRESYNRDSRNPVVEDGSLADDQQRRDFTVNILALGLNKDNFGQLVDPYGGIADLHRQILRTPCDPDVTFSDDPLRMLRAIRFATQLNFRIQPETFDAISRNRDRIAIIKKERIVDELSKIMRSPKPSIGFKLLDMCGLLPLILPEVAALKGVETLEGVGHKDNFAHTLKVLDNVAQRSDFEWLRWAALLHDIGKPPTKKFEPGRGWTFRNHNYIGARMTERLFRRMRMPMNAKLKYVSKMVDLHMRPQQIGEEGVTDSAIRRMRTDACNVAGGPDDLDDLADLMILAEADLTSKNPAKVKRVLETYAKVRKRIIDVTAADIARERPALIGGHEIMETFNIPPSQLLGEIKEEVNRRVEDENLDHESAFSLLIEAAGRRGLSPVEGYQEVKEKFGNALKQQRENDAARRDADLQEKARRDVEMNRLSHPSLDMFSRTLL